jgi:hypothetical protein
VPASSPVEIVWSTVMTVSVTLAIVNLVLVSEVKPKAKNCIPTRKLSWTNDPPTSVRVKVLAAASMVIVLLTPVSAGEVGSPGNGFTRLS